ncbi:MAG: DUF721 domain-containing protein [Fuerstiella sp.]
MGADRTYEAPYDKPKMLGNLLNGLIRRKGIAEESSVGGLADTWKKCCDERVAAKSYVRRQKGDLLEIAVTNGAILEELTGFLKHDLLKQMQQAHPESDIKSLKFVRIQ